MARNRKLKKLKSPCYAVIFYEQEYESIANQILAEFAKAAMLRLEPDDPDKLRAIPAEGDQKENAIWLNFVQS